ncbi:MAG: hypothetical protein WBP82_02300 [Leuconostoc mesenteroides]
MSGQDLTVNSSTVTPVAKKPIYFPQLDNSWGANGFRHTTIGTDSCMPTSLSMDLWIYGLNAILWVLLKKRRL